MPASCIWPESNLCNLKPEQAGGICSITGCFCWTWASKSLFQRSIIFTVHHHRKRPCIASQSIPRPAKVKLVLHVLVLRVTGSVWHTLPCLAPSALWYVYEVNPLSGQLQFILVLVLYDNLLYTHAAIWVVCFQWWYNEECDNMQIYFMLVSNYISTHTVCGSLLFYVLSYIYIIADNFF